MGVKSCCLAMATTSSWPVLSTLTSLPCQRAASGHLRWDIMRQPGVWRGKRVSEQHVVPNMYCRWHYSHCHYSVFSPSCMYTTPTHTHSHDLIFLYWLQGSTIKVNTPAVGKASDDDNLAKGKVRRSTHHHKCTSSVVICIILYNRHITSNYCAVCLRFIVIRLEQYSQETVYFIRLII